MEGSAYARRRMVARCRERRAYCRLERRAPPPCRRSPLQRSLQRRAQARGRSLRSVRHGVGAAAGRAVAVPRAMLSSLRAVAGWATASPAHGLPASPGESALHWQAAHAHDPPMKV
eukprot:144864-Chlamydomonas_euryale.AAC.5